jgi:hypothetical protein
MGEAVAAAIPSCPECGRGIGGERDLLKTRRGRRWIVWGVALVLAGLAVYPSRMFAVKGWAFLPRPVVFIAARFLDIDPGPAGDYGKSLMAALEGAVHDPLPQWQQGLVRRALRANLADRNPADRAAALGLSAAAWEGGNDVERLIPAMIGLLRDPTPRVQDAAARAVFAVRAGDATLLDEWETVARDSPSFSARLIALLAMGEILKDGHGAALAPLMRIAWSSGGPLRLRALAAAAHSRDARVAYELTLTVSDPQSLNPAVDALLSLRSMEEGAAIGVPHLLDLVLNSDSPTRIYAIRALGAAGAAAAPAAPFLLPLATDIESSLGPDAIRALGLIGVPTPGAVEAVRAQMMNWGGQQGDAAMECLFRWGWEPDAAALAVIRKRTAVNHHGSRAWPRLYLARVECREAEVVPDLVRLTDEAYYWEAVGAVRALGALGPTAAPAIPRLAELVRTRDYGPENFGEEARMALRQIDPNWREPKKRPPR